MIALCADTPELAYSLQQQTGLPMADEAGQADYLLCATAGRVELRSCKEPAMQPLFVDFVAGANRHRRLHGGGRGQAIAKAVGLGKLRAPAVADLTAGLGRDAFVLATLGCSVTLVERSPVVHALLRDGLARARNCQTAVVREIAARMHLVHADSREWLSLPGAAFDVIYLDPMFPERRKSALVKKEMRFFKDFLGTDEDAAALLEPARAHCRSRVVVKRPSKAPFLGGHEPSYSVPGKSTRFDIYLAASQHQDQASGSLEGCASPDDAG